MLQCPAQEISPNEKEILDQLNSLFKKNGRISPMEKGVYDLFNTEFSKKEESTKQDAADVIKKIPLMMEQMIADMKTKGVFDDKMANQTINDINEIDLNSQDITKIAFIDSKLKARKR